MEMTNPSRRFCLKVLWEEPPKLKLPPGVLATWDFPLSPENRAIIERIRVALIRETQREYPWAAGLEPPPST
jgi:hypothetical protein